MAKDPDPVEWVQYPAAISAAPMARYRLGRGEWVVGVLATPPPVAASADLIGQRRHRTSAHTQRTETENKKEEPKKKSRNDRQKMKRTKKKWETFLHYGKSAIFIPYMRASIPGGGPLDLLGRKTPKESI